MNELNLNLHNIIEKVKLSYANIETLTGIKLHSFKGLENFQNKIGEDVSLFMNFSRGKAIEAQSREFLTKQPKEKLLTLTKAKITITNFLGGQYFFTVDEVEVTSKLLYLIEGKHSDKSILPSIGDIKDGLLKMILYCNLSQTKFNGKSMKCLPILQLTSAKMQGKISSNSSKKEIEDFFFKNKLNLSKKNLLENLFKEAKTNNFIVNICKSND